MMELLKSPLTFWIIWVYQHLKVRKYCRLDYMARIENCWLEGQNRLYRDAVLKNCKVGRGTYFGRGSHVQDAVIGRYCSIAPNVVIGGGIHPTDQRSTHPSQYEPGTIEGKQVEIGSDVWIGQGAIILDGVKIGNGAVIGAGTVVTRHVHKFSIVAGNPMKAIRKRPIQDETWY